MHDLDLVYTSTCRHRIKSNKDAFDMNYSTKQLIDQILIVVFLLPVL